ncbi:diguanylate cyclase domain-containing protein [Shewanella sp.]|uniref:sensor domain-containing diguanylate cyclase n=1 Tax=Shewanella sp. TaxID=50422 RepID=UPI003A97C615
MPATEKWLAQKRLKTLLLFCGVLFAVFFVMSWSSYQVATSAVTHQIEKNSLPLTSDNVYSQIQRDLVTPIFIARLMAHDTFVRDWALQTTPAAEPMQRYLTEINKRFGTFLSFFVLEKDNRYFLPDRVLDVTQLPGNKDWYQQVKQLPAEQYYRVDIGHDPDHPERTDIYIDHLVYDYDGNQIGITGVGLSVNEVRKLITRYQQKYQRTIYFVDAEGTVVLQSHASHLSSLAQREGISEIYPKLFQQESNSYHFYDSEGKVYLHMRLVEEFGWYIVVEERENSSQTRLFLQFLINIGIALVVTAIVLLVSLLTQSGFQRRLARAASFDPLTGASNRRAGEAIFSTMRKHSHSLPIALMLVDIDHFKQINDSHGHEVGDQMLMRLVEHCRRHVRESDIICRWGGEEFVMLFAQCEQVKANELAERIRQGVEQLAFNLDGKRLQMTISAGLVMVGEQGKLAHWVNQADEALYRAKEQGRNRVIWHVTE